jgi:hypothetical protein
MGRIMVVISAKDLLSDEVPVLKELTLQWGKTNNEYAMCQMVLSAMEKSATGYRYQRLTVLKMFREGFYHVTPRQTPGVSYLGT